MSVVLTGSIAYDYIMSFPGYFKDHILPEKIHEISVSFLVDSMKKQRGGIAPNIAYSLALLGERPKIMATVGEDFEEYRRWLELHFIDTSAINVIPDEFTASFFVSTDKQQNQTASFYTGAMAHAHLVSFNDHVNGGIELAVEGQTGVEIPAAPHDPEAPAPAPSAQSSDAPFQLVVRDDGGESLQAVASARELATVPRAPVILGPLLVMAVLFARRGLVGLLGGNRAICGSGGADAGGAHIERNSPRG